MKLYILLSLLLLVWPTKQEATPLQINFDYSQLKVNNLYIKKLIITELNKIASNIKDLLLCTNNQNLYRDNKKNKERLIKCDNPKIKVEYEKQNIDKNTFLLIFPRIVINPKSDNKNIL